MMKHKIMILGALMLMMSVTSCHKESDGMLSYVYNDDMAFAGAQKSYAEEFKVFWNAMNSTYSLWDYEEACGLDWDEHYRVMLPKFEALDTTTSKVSDEQLKKLMEEMVAPLHDGHMKVSFMNHATGNYVKTGPGIIRNEERPDFMLTYFVPDLHPYYDRQELVELKEVNTDAEDQYKRIMNADGIGLSWAQDKQKELINKEQPTGAEATTLYHLDRLIAKLEELQKKYSKVTQKTIEEYNAVVSQYAFLNVPYLEPINTIFCENGIEVKYALFKDNIAYFYLSSFSLTPYMTAESINKVFGADKQTMELAKQVNQTYSAWFQAVQRLHKEKKLKGVIIDLRSNPGGLVSDSYYLLGSMLPKGGFQIGYTRYKRGPGRYDYSPFMPSTIYTMDTEHEIVDDVPITLLVNCWSVSMSEATSLTAKQMPNARLIGMRTWGGICALSDATDFSTNYAGNIGVENKTPVYVYLPMVAAFDMNKQSLEGVGIEPDITVDLDEDQHNLGHDTQLERALQYIRTGN